MDEHPHGTENVVDLLNFTISDEKLEKAAGGTPCAHSYPGTGVATFSLSQTPHFLRSSGLKLLSRDEARRIVSKIVKLPGLLRKL